MAKYTSRFSGPEIDQRLGDVPDKVGDAYFDFATNTQYLFKSTEDKLAWIGGDTSVEVKTCPFEFSGTVRRMIVINEMDGKNLYYTQQSGSAVITVGFKSEEKGITDASWSEVLEDALITVEVDRGSTGSFSAIISEQAILNGTTFSFDVFKYLATGNNRIKVTIVGVDTGSSANIVYTALLTSMYLAPADFRWSTPFIEGQPYSLGGLYIGGSIDKVLKIKVSNEQTYQKLYEINRGTQTNTSIAYYYGGLEFPTEGTGVYNVEMWLDANGLESEHLHYNIMCVAASDIDTAQLIAVSNVLSVVNNYDTNKLFSYAVYNGGKATASPIVNVSAIINNIPTSIVKDEILKDVPTGSANDYTIGLEIDTQEYNIQLYSSIELGDSKQEAIYAIDNSLSYPAVAGAEFYLNPVNRNNSQENKTTIINESNLATATKEFTATWENVSFTDGMDGWTVDNQGRKCLRLPAMSKMIVDYAPFANAVTRTLEISYRVENSANYNEDVISVASDLTSQFVGVRIKPTNVLLHSEGLRTDDLMQGYNTKDEELVHLLVTVIQNYKQIGNLAQIYVNGVKKCSFEWISEDTFAHNGNLAYGSNTADLYVYKTRVYTEAFDWVMSSQNFVSCLPDTDSKKAASEKIKSVLNDGNEIDFEKVKSGGRNYFTLRLPDGAKLPSIISQSSVEHTMLEINIQQNPLFAINGIYEDEETEGQGTTAMNYFRWNLRWKTETIRITAKKNFASSMHSHKMGATALFNDLNRMIVGANEADARVAVEQYAAYGFLEVQEGATDQYNYIPIGLYTIGQDKGDKATFGYNNKAYKGTLIHLEGSDHKPKAIGMDYPWSKLSVYTNSDGDSFLGVKKEDGSAEKAWEIGACGSAESDAEMFTYLTQEFKPAYDCDYRNTMMLVGVEKGTDINAQDFRNIPTTYGFTNADCLVWIDGEYQTYYYDEIQKKYLKDGINILDDLEITEGDLKGATVAEKNQEIIELRKLRYREDMGNYWHLRDNLFHYCFLILFAATDNFKKNTYPYKFGTLESGSRWRWRQDDLDTLADINNQGLATKIYSILNGDKSLDNQLFNGNTSYHWTNIQFYYENEIKSMMLEILTAMASLSDTGDSLIEKAVGCVRKYFWDKAQEYFTKSAYNLDAEWSYEEAWAAMKDETYDAPVHPLQQSLGSHYEAERAWFELRFLFMASLYGFGAFGIGNSKDTSLGQISFRLGKGTSPFEFTPAIDMNPTILIGDSNSINAERRVKQNEKVSLPITTTESDTSIYIQGADYLSDIGDFSKVNLYPDNPALTIQSKRLQKLKVGDENAEDVITVLKTLNVLSCPSLSEVDARNVSTLTGTIDLSQCPRLRTALFGGSSASNISLPKGSKITEFELPNTLTTLSLLNLPNLTETGLTYGELNALTYLRVENTQAIAGWALLKATYESGSPLTNIRVIGFDYDGDSTDLSLLAKLASGGYFGINEDGSRNPDIIPVLEGTLNVAGYAYQDDIDVIESAYQGRVTINITGGYYIRFKDPVFNQLIADIYGNGVGTTQEQADKVSWLPNGFLANNTDITDLSDLDKFSNLKGFNEGSFRGCYNIKEIILPSPSETLLLGTNCFDMQGVTTAHINNFYCNKPFNASTLCFRNIKFTNIYFKTLDDFLSSASLSSLGDKLEDNGNIWVGGEPLPNRIVIPEHITQIYMLANCKNVTDIVLHDKITLLETVGTSITSLRIPPLITGEIYDYRISFSTTIVDLDLNNLSVLGHNTFYYFAPKRVWVSSMEKWINAQFINNEASPVRNGTTLYIGSLGDTSHPVNIDDVNQSMIGQISITNEKFKGLDQLVGDLIIPDGVVSIFSDAFRGCSNIASITIGKDVEIIGIGTNNTTNYAGNTFNGCNKLSLIKIQATAPPDMFGNNNFSNTNNCPIYVPDESVKTYQDTTGWSEYASRIKGLSDIIGLALKPTSGLVFKTTKLITTYNGIEVTPEYSIVGTVATLDSNVLTFNEIGEVTVTATYNGESVSRTYTWDGTTIAIENGVVLQNNGTTTSNSTMSTVGFIPTNGATKITWGVTGGTLGILCEYKDDGSFVDYWSAIQNPRTITLTGGTRSTQLKASFSTQHIEDAYVINATTGEYLWKGNNV